jgi:hypothetical protein
MAFRRCLGKMGQQFSIFSVLSIFLEAAKYDFRIVFLVGYTGVYPN